MRNLISRTGLVFAIALCMTVACWAQTDTSQQGSYPTQHPSHAASSFLKKAMQDSEAEIELGHLAQTKAQNQQVKDFANMMVTDHTQALNRLHDAMGTSTSSTYNKSKQSADTTRSTGSIQLSKDAQQLKNRLSKLSGPAFDLEYMNIMVQEHRKDVREFEMEAGLAPGSTTSSTSDTSSDSQTATRAKPGMNANPNSAPAIARELLPTLKKHLEEAEKIQRELAQQK